MGQFRLFPRRVEFCSFAWNYVPRFIKIWPSSSVRKMVRGCAGFPSHTLPVSYPITLSLEHLNVNFKTECSFIVQKFTNAVQLFTTATVVSSAAASGARRHRGSTGNVELLRTRAAEGVGWMRGCKRRVGSMQGGRKVRDPCVGQVGWLVRAQGGGGVGGWRTSHRARSACPSVEEREEEGDVEP